MILELFRFVTVSDTIFRQFGIFTCIMLIVAYVAFNSIANFISAMYELYLNGKIKKLELKLSFQMEAETARLVSKILSNEGLEKHEIIDMIETIYDRKINIENPEEVGEMNESISEQSGQTTSGIHSCS